MNLWRLIVHHEDPEAAFESIEQTGRIAIGWYDVGDMRNEGFSSAAEVGEAIRENYPELDNSHTGGPSLWDFYYNMKPGDLVILSASNVGKRRRAVVVVEGPYEFVSEGTTYDEGYPHQRRVRPVTLEELPDKLWALSGGASGKPLFQTLVNCHSA